jgi:uncharacterized RDD family membrane protein YckC
MSGELRIAVRRLSAFAVDWLVVALWGGVLFGVVMIATEGEPPRVRGPWMGQVIGLLAMTAPATLYFAFTESSGLQASLGKLVVGLVVRRQTGEPLSLGSALLRTAVKFVPWELGHTVAQQAAFSSDSGLPAWVWGAATVALIGPVWWLAVLVSTGRTPYDRWTATQVARRSTFG